MCTLCLFELLTYLCFVCQQVTSQIPLCPFDTETAGCPKDPHVKGFPTLRDIFCIMERESLFTIFKGSSPRRPPYVYRLCPNTVYSISEQEQIAPVLNQTHFVCGNNGNSKDNCIIDGGSVQVFFQDNPEEVDHPLEYVKFEGITFQSSNGASIYSIASSILTVEFADCHWRDHFGYTVFLLSHNQATQRQLYSVGQDGKNRSIGSKLDSDSDSVKNIDLADIYPRKPPQTWITASGDSSASPIQVDGKTKLRSARRRVQQLDMLGLNLRMRECSITVSR